MYPPLVGQLLATFTAEAHLFPTAQDTCEPWERLSESTALGDPSLGVTGIFSAWAQGLGWEGVSQAALLLADGSTHFAPLYQGFVVDFAARFLAPQAPWPLVLEVEEWGPWLQAHSPHLLLRTVEGDDLTEAPELLRYL